MSLGWLQRRPVLSACLLAIGLAMAAVGLFAIFAPPAALDFLWQLGNARLGLALLGVLILCLVAGLAAGLVAALRDGPSLEEEEEEEVDPEGVLEAEVEQEEDASGEIGAAASTTDPELAKPKDTKRYFT